MVTPQGRLETRRLPGSGAGPSPDRLFIGSEGIFGIITEAWMRLQDRPRFRAGGAVRLKDFFAAARGVRMIAQAGLFPSNCRVLDPQEAFNTGAGDGNSAVMLLAFKSADHPGESWMQRALECCRDHGGIAEGNEGADAHREGAAGRWRNAFIRMPYGRERMVPRARCERPAGTSHLPFHPCRLIEQWQAIKQAASDQPSPTTTRLVAIIDLGTIASARSSSRQHSKRQNRHWIHAACSIPAYSSIPERGVRSDPLGIARFARRDAAAFKQFLQRYL